MSNEVFHMLKQELASTDDLDVLVKAMQRLAASMVQLLGPEAQAVPEIVEQLKAELEHSRYGASQFLTLFSGKGPVARRICDASVIDELLYGPHHGLKEVQVAKVLAKFNYFPSQDPSHIHDMHHFCQHAYELVQLGNLQITPYEAYGIQTPQTARTGFYFTEDEDTGRVHALVLAGTIAETDVRVAFFTGTYSAARLWLYHPQECTWVPYEGTAVLPGMLECLEAQLQAAYHNLSEAYKTRDWPAEFAAAAELAHQLLTRSTVLPVQHRGFLRLGPHEAEICVNEDRYRVRYAKTTGDYPSETTTILTDVAAGGAVAFTTSFTALDLMTQCRLTCAVQFELGVLLRHIEAAEKLAHEDAVSP